ncbi:MAG: HD domain-containing phosphohydrolase [Sedimenticola sp.]
MRILIADDHEDARTYLEIGLSTQGHEVITAIDGQDALNLVRQEKPDLVISDGLMPRMDGFELCRQLKRDKVIRAIPFIFYTGTYVDKRDRELALAMGAARFLVKPMEPEDLLNVIGEVMAEQEAASVPTAEELEQIELLERHRDTLARKLGSKTEQLEEGKRELYLTETRYRRLVESLEHNYFFYSHDTNGVITYVSPSIRNILGYATDEFMVHYSEFLTDHPVNRHIEQHTQAAIRGEMSSPYELEIYHKDGSRRCLEVTEFPVKDELGKVVAFEGIAHDITDLVRSREAAADLASKNAMILESAGEGIFGLDKEGNHTFANSAAATMLGYSTEELLGAHSHTLWHHSRPDNKPYPEQECPIYYVLKYGVTKRGEENFLCKGGTFFPVEFTGTPIFKGGEVEGAVVSFLDISERKKHERRLQRSLEQTVQVVATALEQRDPYTAGHQRRVAELAKAIASEIGLDERDIDGLYVGGIIHDVGKISIPVEILTRPGKLSESEFNVIKAHVKNGAEIINSVDFPWPVKDMVMQHHERLDGSGYPKGLKAEEIILEARILAVADVIEAITAHRPYRPALGIDVGLEEITKHKGVLYDSDVVEACLNLFQENRFSWS